MQLYSSTMVATVTDIVVLCYSSSLFFFYFFCFFFFLFYPRLNSLILTVSYDMCNKRTSVLSYALCASSGHIKLEYVFMLTS